MAVCTAILATFGVMAFEQGIARAANSYVNPLSALSGLQPARIDQGVDYYSSGGNILAIGDGTVTYAKSSGSGWNPGGAFIEYKLTDGPATNYSVYVAECINLLVTGGTVTAGQAIASMNTHCAYGPECAQFCIETGWACQTAYGSAQAGCTGQDQGNFTLTTAYGCNFNAMLTWLGAPSGTSSCTQPLNNPPIPSTWPTWPPAAGSGDNRAVDAKGDFNGDGYSDLAVLYNYGGTTTGLFVFPGSQTGLQSPTLVWQSTSFSWSATSGLVVSDFNRDGYADIAALYNYGGTTTGLFVWPGTPTGIHATGLVWKSTSFSFGATGRLAIGDFNGDGYIDLAALYNYAGTTTGLFVWPGSQSGLVAASLVWKSTSFSFGDTGALAVGDFNRDGNADVAALYNYGGNTTGLFVWPGSSSGLFGTSLVWKSTSFSFADTGGLAVGEFYADGYDDLAALYNYGGNTTGLFIWSGSSLGLSVTYLVWKSTSFSFGDTGGLAVGDFNGDGYTDLSALYNYGGTTTGLFDWPGSRSGPNTTGLVWKSTSFSFGATSTLAFGNFNWDAFDDVAVLYNYGGTTTGLFVWPGSPSSLNGTSLVWKSTSFSFGACKMA